jgi:hypothetical protein
MDEVGLVSHESIKHVRGFKNFLEHCRVHFPREPRHFAEAFKLLWAKVTVRRFSRKMEPEE